MVEPDDDGEYLQSVLPKITKGLRKACREIVVFSLLSAVIVFCFHYADPDGVGIAIASSLVLGFMIGFFVWLLYKFARFVIGR